MNAAILVLVSEAALMMVLSSQSLKVSGRLPMSARASPRSCRIRAVFSGSITGMGGRGSASLSGVASRFKPCKSLRCFFSSSESCCARRYLRY